MRRTWWDKGLWTAILAAALLGWALPQPAAEGAVKRITLLGGQVGGAWNPWASAMSVDFSKNIPGLNVSSEAGTGSPENVRRVHRGEVETGFGFSSDIHEAWRGGGIFKAPHTNLRAVSKLFGVVTHLIVLANSDIQKLEDIAGKTIAVGGPNSGSALTFERLARQAGLWGKFKPVFLGGGKAASAIGDGQVAAFNWTPGMGDRLITQIAVTNPSRLIELHSAAEKSGFYQKYPYYSPRTIPAGTYKGIDKPVATFQQTTVWTANKDLPADIVYRMVKRMYSPEAKAFLSNAVGRVFGEMAPDTAFSGVTIPLHPGAERFWKEKGVAIPKEIAAR
ncbi:MAG: TAXI family TRAP transporter solute-binding subunit [Candidatus Tectomicrobia bacterium]|uniref:TAXI family TRAP transporter solute-binding subunit n=1 Tax=Tectimicrobiota bacterium TaxID=2528274 RepID=A0A932I2P1_UNCTE|nr:TAXI family TRAP transporter solute-binding subunit [Candidatus Tectomicrobia bacterium]